MHTNGIIPRTDAGALDPALTVASNWWNHLWWHNNVDTSTFAAPTDAVFFYIFWVSTFFFVLLMVLMVAFAIKYRRVPGRAPEPSASHNTALELAWSIIPTILMAVMFVWGLVVYIPTRIPPANAETINVTAQKWNWTWLYDNGATTRQFEKIADVDAPVLALPVDRPTRFVMTSKDVIHSMYIAAFRIKRDVMPNQFTTLWVQPTKLSHRYDEALKQFVAIQPGVNDGYYLACTEYCGDQHSQMWGRVMVLSEADYRTWKSLQADTGDIDLKTLGAILHKGKGCISCHSLDGSKGTGPSWKGIWGATEKFTDGGSALVDENYVRESILEPAKHIVAGYSNQMQSYQGQVTDRELLALITFIKSLSANPADLQSANQDAVKELEAAGKKVPDELRK